MLKYKQHRKLIEITCDCCGKKFLKPISEYNRNIRLGRKNYCSRHCVGIANTSNLSAEWYKSECNKQNLRNINQSSKDEYTPFKNHMRRIKRRFKDYDITKENLKELWDKQNGICPYSGLKMTLEFGHMNSASLDRIDSSKGYMKNNIQFVVLPINYLKNSYSDLDVKRFLKSISSYTSRFREDETISSSENQMLDALAGN